MSKITIVLNTEDTLNIKIKVDRLAKAISSFEDMLGKAEEVDLIVNVDEIMKEDPKQTNTVNAVGFATNQVFEDEIYE